jgi:hypothetical protein
MKSNTLWLILGGVGIYFLLKKASANADAAAQAAAANSVGVLAPSAVPDTTASGMLMSGLGVPTVPSSVSVLGPTPVV